MRTPRRQLGQTSMTLEASIGISLESRPPCWFLALGFRCLKTRLIPSTTILFRSGMTRSTFEILRWVGLPLSSPEITSTWSSLRMCMVGSRLSSGTTPGAGRLGLGSDHLGGQADDLHELAVAELAGD